MKFVIYPDYRSEWRWRLVARNGRIIADSGESYVSLRNCREAVERLSANAPVAAVEVRRMPSAA